MPQIRTAAGLVEVGDEATDASGPLQRWDVPYVGAVDFPADFSEEQIAAAAKSLYEDALAEATRPAWDVSLPARSAEELAARNFYIREQYGLPQETTPGPSFGQMVSTPFVRIPRPTAQEITDAVDVLTGRINEPQREPTAGAQIMAGSQAAVANAVEALLSPIGVATLGQGALPSVAQRAVSGAFAAHMASQIPELARQAGVASVEGDLAARAEAYGNLGLTGGFVAGAGLHAAGPRTPPSVLLARALERSRLSGAPDEIYALPLRAPPLEAFRGVRIPEDLFRARQQERIGPESKPAAPPAQETITGRDVREGTEIPAERGEIPRQQASAPLPPTPGVEPTPPAPRQRRAERLPERPPDLIDWIQGEVGTIQGKKYAKSATEDLYPEAYLSAMRTSARRVVSQSGVSPDVAAQMAYDARRISEPTAEALWNELHSAARERADWIRAARKENRQLDELAKQAESFFKVAVEDRNRGKGIASEPITVTELLPGDAFDLGGTKVTVKEVHIDPDTQQIRGIVLEDGRRFGVQTVDPNEVQVIYADRGSYAPSARATEFLPPEQALEGAAAKAPESQAPPASQAAAPPPEPPPAPTSKAGEIAPPRLRQGEKQGDLLSGQREDLSLAGEKGIDFERIARERAEAEAARAEAARFEAEHQQRMFEEAGEDIGPPGAGELGEPAGAPPGGAGPGLPAPPAPIPGAPVSLGELAAPQVGVIHGRLQVRLDRNTTLPAVAIPKIMRALEAVIRAAGGGRQTQILTGRIAQRFAAGIFKPFSEVIRLRQADNVPTATHEIGHALQQALYRTAYAIGLKGLPPAVKRELVALGRALYGTTRPAAGYTGEGFAEYMRMYLTTDDFAVRAPVTTEFFEQQVLPGRPKIAAALKSARKLIDTYRDQGALVRMQQQYVRSPNAVRRFIQHVQNAVTVRNWIEEGEALWRIGEVDFARSGQRRPPSQDPFLLFSWKRGTAGSVVRYMVDDAMIDVWGRPTGGMSLKQALGPVVNRLYEFGLYVYARRAIERWEKGKNPGVSLEDAMFVRQLYDSPEFQLAAHNYYQWNDGLLNYMVQANPALAPLVRAIKASSYDYAPLARVIDPADATAAAMAARSNPLYRMKGSGRQVREIFETTLENAARMVSHAHRHMVLDSIVKFAKLDPRNQGLGAIIEEVPRAVVTKRINLELIRQDLENMGVDTSAIPLDTVFTYFTHAETPKGLDPIVAVKEVDGIHWYRVAPGIYEVMAGLDPVKLSTWADFFMGMPGRVFRMGTTGLNPEFSMVTNPARDFQTWLANSVTHANPVRMAAEYFGRLFGVVVSGLTGKRNVWDDAFVRLAAQIGQPLGLDVGYTRRAAKELGRGRFRRIVTTPIEHLRDILGVTESVPRIAELKILAKEIGWKPDQPMTPDQAVQLAIAAKRATVDFSAGGKIARKWNLAVPFLNAHIQGHRSFFRAYKQDPKRFFLRGLTIFTLPALASWWKNKDEDWYRGMLWRERFLYTSWRDEDGDVWQIARPPEWGNAFQVIPEALADYWWLSDPETAEKAFTHIFETSNPLDLPVLARIAKEQLQNRIDFFDRPIVPMGELDLPAAEQFGPYTSKLAKWISQAYAHLFEVPVIGETARQYQDISSPRRIDAAMRGLAGGALPDLLDMLGLGSARLQERDPEAADFPVIGRIWRRGGDFSAANQALADFYDEYYQMRRRAASKVKPLIGPDLMYWQSLSDTYQNIKNGQELARREADVRVRRSLYRNMSKDARAALDRKPKEMK